MKHKSLYIVLALLFLFSVLPYLIAFNAAGQNHVFEGFLLNPIDGNSYLAKMQLGWEGQWKFTLPYTAEAGEGGYLFLFYIFLGHIGRWLNLPLIFVFHFARIAAVVFLTFTLYVYTLRVFPDSQTWARRVFAWICLGGGLGWLLFPFGILTSDLWVPEAYSFLSGYVNPHFPLGLALLLWIFMWSERDEFRFQVFIFLGGLALAVVFPFAVVVAAAVLLIQAGWQWIKEKKLALKNLLALFLGGGVFISYQFWISTSDPVLAGWNAQNLTLSPPAWDLLIAFSPAFLAAIYVFRYFRTWNFSYLQKLNAAWFVSSLILILVPFSLQRRFLLGFFIPTVILAGIGISLSIRSLKVQRRFFMLAFALSIPSLLIILALGTFGIVSVDPRLYIQKDEQQAFGWVTDHTAQNAVILAAPDTGNLIPAQTGRRVIYGHPFETVNAELRKKQVSDLFTGIYPLNDSLNLLTDLKVNYIFYGPREKLLGAPEFIKMLKPVYQNQDVTIFAVN
jgi:hypothetical protein